MSSSLGHITGLFWCASAGASMRTAEQLRVIAGQGLEGDRYATGQGAYSDTQPPKIRHMILDYSDDVELLEIILPADFKTVELTA